MAPRLTSRTIELRRVVITGMGSVNPLGNDVPTSWRALLKGVSGVRPIVDRFPDIESFPVRFAAQIEGFDPASVVEKKEVRRLDPFQQYAIAAAQEAMDHSGLRIDDANAERVGVLVGTGIAGLTTMLENCDMLRAKGRVSPFFVPISIGNMASGLVSIRFGARGPNSCVVTACTTGTHAIGDAARIIQRGDADAMIAGGVEAPVTPLGIGGFASMKALSTRNDDPQRASRPFDRGRDGFVVGEGAGIVVLESLETALARGAEIHAEIVGYGMSGDAHHMTAPAEDGLGAQSAMRNAIAAAGLEPSDVDYINAHGTSTTYNDRIETYAIRQVFGDHADRLAVSSTKSMTGHLLGGAGGLEAIITALALRDGVMPPTINLTDPDPACDLDYVPNEAREAPLRVAISNSFGFGGTNGCLALARYDAAEEAA